MHDPAKFLERATQTICDRLADLSVIALLFLTAVVCLGVTMRYVFNNALTWADELGGFSLLAIVFFGISYTLNTDGHIRVDFLSSRISGKAKAALNLASYGLGLVFSVLLVAGAWMRLENFWVRNTHGFTDLYTPLYIPALPLIVGSVVFFLTMLSKTIQYLLTLTHKG